MLLNLLIWVIIVLTIIAVIRIVGPKLGVDPDTLRVVMLVIGAILLIALLIMIWPLLSNPGGWSNHQWTMLKEIPCVS